MITRHGELSASKTAGIGLVLSEHYTVERFSMETYKAKSNGDADIEDMVRRLNSFDLHAVHDVIASHSNEVPEEGDIVVICRSGMRSQMAIMFLTQAGIDANRLYNLDGGIMAWSQIAPEDVIRG